MSEISARLRRRIGRDFGPQGDAEAVMVLVAANGRIERVQAAIVLAASGVEGRSDLGVRFNV